MKNMLSFFRFRRMIEKMKQMMGKTKDDNDPFDHPFAIL